MRLLSFASDDALPSPLAADLNIMFDENQRSHPKCHCHSCLRDRAGGLVTCPILETHLAPGTLRSNAESLQRSIETKVK